jgi:hypothetical protein
MNCSPVATSVGRPHRAPRLTAPMGRVAPPARPSGPEPSPPVERRQAPGPTMLIEAGRVLRRVLASRAPHQAPPTGTGRQWPPTYRAPSGPTVTEVRTAWTRWHHAAFGASPASAGGASPSPRAAGPWRPTPRPRTRGRRMTPSGETLASSPTSRIVAAGVRERCRRRGHGPYG